MKSHPVGSPQSARLSFIYKTLDRQKLVFYRVKGMVSTGDIITFMSITYSQCSRIVHIIQGGVKVPMEGLRLHVSWL